MNTRYKITRLDEHQNPTITLEECQAFFAQLDEFIYSDHYIINSNGTQMHIPGHFFMWQVEQGQIPFRFFDGEIYVAISHPLIFEKMVQIAVMLEANYVEG